LKKIVVFILAIPTLYLLLLVPNMLDAIHLRFVVSPEYVLNRFYTEKDLGDSLILAGSRMVPLLEKEVLNKRIPRRLYAIGALGMMANKNSIPIFEQILQDKTEITDFRASALRAVASIDLTTAQQLAFQYLNDKDEYVGYTAQRILASDLAYLEKRSYWDAFTHRHYP
jgi:hypothetical protein